MSRTSHHKAQKFAHCGHDYGARYNCNKGYGSPYGSDSRNAADRERRMEAKRVIRQELAQ